MINRFRNLNPLNLILIIAIAIFLRLGVIMELPAKLSFDFVEPFAKLLIPIPLEHAFSPIANLFIALIITLIQAFIFNRIINKYNLIGKPTFLPALLYITTSCLLAPFVVLNPTLICNFLTLWMIEKLLSIYKREDVRSVMYDLGMIIAVGTIIYFPFIAMLPLLWASLFIFRPFSWREWAIGALGFCSIFFFLWVFYYWNDSTEIFYKIWLPLAAKFPTKIEINFYDYLVLIPVIVILIIGFIQLRSNFFRSFVQVRKSFQSLFVMFLLGILSFYLKADLQIYHFLLCVPPASVLMAYYFLNATKPWFYESLYLVLVSFIIYFQVV